MQYLNKQALYQKMDEIRCVIPIFPKSIETYPIQLQQLFPHLHIVGHDMNSKKVSGLLLRNQSSDCNSVIILNTSRPILAQRFTLTHELVHYLLHTDINNFLCNDDDASFLEWQANEGAAELLVPYRSFLRIFKNKRSSYLSNPTGTVEQLAHQYSVSTTVIRNRIKSLSLEIQQYLTGTALDNIKIISRKASFMEPIFPAGSSKFPQALDILRE